MDVVVAATNKTPVSSVRGAGYPQAAFVMERLMDRIAARELALERAEMRRRNLIPAERCHTPSRSRRAPAPPCDSGDYPACQAAVLAAAGWADFPARQAAARRAGLSRYRLAHGIKGTGRGPFEFGRCGIDIGRVSVLTGAAAMGQGVKTVLAQICAGEARRAPGRHSR